jgi:hypothetical protein
MMGVLASLLRLIKELNNSSAEPIKNSVNRQNKEKDNKKTTKIQHKNQHKRLKY